MSEQIETLTDIQNPLVKVFANDEMIPGVNFEEFYKDFYMNFVCPLGIVKINKEGKIITVFGCGGNRDKSKRPEMGKIASDLSDVVIVTSDNCRNERKMDIIIDILKGIEKDDFEVIPNRKEAIKRALSLKKEGDVVVLLGKGHENYEIDSTGKHYFSEKEIVAEYLYDKNNASYGI